MIGKILKYIVIVMLLVPVSVVGNARISLLTVGPGKEMYQLEGHSALRIVTDDGQDLAVNWGVFDFNTPNFAYRFVKGETDYSIGITSMAGFLADYASTGRYVIEQPLNLTEAEVTEALRLIGINMLPENRTYRYNYFRDNCATRPLAIIEKALAADGAHLKIDSKVEDTTLRADLRKYHAQYPSYQLFIDFALGSGIDSPVTPRERAFAPVYLMTMASESEIVNADGTTRPLTSGEITLEEDRLGATSEQGMSAWLLVTLLTLATVIVTVRDIRRKRVTRWFDACFYTLYGVIGCLCAFLVFVSVHEATSPNINLLWANPLCLIIPLLIWFKKCKYIVFYYQIINFALILIWLAGQPIFHQSTNFMLFLLAASDMMRSASYIYLNKSQCINRIKD